MRLRRRRRLAEGIVSDTAIGFGAATIEGTGPSEWRARLRVRQWPESLRGAR